jgi:Cu(I)/Ag(I) efflux system membrane fusion protein
MAVLLAILSASAGYRLRGWFVPPADSMPAAEREHDETGAKSTQVWTCSMHPQIRLPQPGQCPICAMDLIPASTDEDDDTGASMRTFKPSEAAKTLMQIRTSPVERRFVTADIRMVGKVDYDETKLGYITAWVPGRIDRLYVDYTGINVEKGDHLVYLYSPEILSAQEELRRGASAVATMRSDAPDVLKRTAQSTLEAARSKLRRWGLTDEQIAEAAEKGIVSDHITIYAPMGGTVIERMGQEGMYVETGTKIYTIADLREVWVMLDAYESDLPWIHYGQTVEFTNQAFPGEVFSGTIAFIDPMLDEMTRTVKVRVNVPNKDGRLKPEMFVRAVVRSQIATGGRVMDPGLAGKWISPMHPEIVKSGPGSCDICGMALVPAEKLGYVPAGAGADDMPLVIPASAALITGKRAIVYVEMPDAERPIYEGREVMLGARAGDYYIVRSGLSEGELVVTNGNFKIDSALQLHAKPSMMTPDGGITPGSDDDLDLPFTLLEQLEAVNTAFVAVGDAVQLETMNALSAALSSLEKTLANVEMKLFPPEAHAVWMEYSMRLKNDIMEMSDAMTDKARTRALDKMAGTMAQIRLRLGLPHSSIAAEVPKAPEEFQKQLSALTRSYFTIQTPLADDNLAGAKDGSASALEALEAIDPKVLDESMKAQWTETDDAALRAAVDALAEASDIAAFRAQFKDLSDALTAALQTYGLPPDENAFVVHCPMAFDSEGADWLQADSDEVLNPYYGSVMLHCGDVTARIGSPTARDSGSANGHDHAAHGGSTHE